jgi:hypothetical protein
MCNSSTYLATAFLNIKGMALLSSSQLPVLSQVEAVRNLSMMYIMVCGTSDTIDCMINEFMLRFKKKRR